MPHFSGRTGRTDKDRAWIPAIFFFLAGLSGILDEILTSCCGIPLYGGNKSWSSFPGLHFLIIDQFRPCKQEGLLLGLTPWWCAGDSVLRSAGPTQPTGAPVLAALASTALQGNLDMTGGVFQADRIAWLSYPLKCDKKEYFSSEQMIDMIEVL